MPDWIDRLRQKLASLRRVLLTTRLNWLTEEEHREKLTRKEKLKTKWPRWRRWWVIRSASR